MHSSGSAAHPIEIDESPPAASAASAASSSRPSRIAAAQAASSANGRETKDATEAKRSGGAKGAAAASASAAAAPAVAKQPLKRSRKAASDDGADGDSDDESAPLKKKRSSSGGSQVAAAASASPYDSAQSAIAAVHALQRRDTPLWNLNAQSGPEKTSDLQRLLRTMAMGGDSARLIKDDHTEKEIWAEIEQADFTLRDAKGSTVLHTLCDPHTYSESVCGYWSQPTGRAVNRNPKWIIRFAGVALRQRGKQVWLETNNAGITPLQMLAANLANLRFSGSEFLQLVFPTPAAAIEAMTWLDAAGNSVLHNLFLESPSTARDGIRSVVFGVAEALCARPDLLRTIDLFQVNLKQEGVLDRLFTLLQTRVELQSESHASNYWSHEERNKVVQAAQQARSLPIQLMHAWLKANAPKLLGEWMIKDLANIALEYLLGSDGGSFEPPVRVFVVQANVVTSVNRSLHREIAVRSTDTVATLIERARAASARYPYKDPNHSEDVPLVLDFAGHEWALEHTLASVGVEDGDTVLIKPKTGAAAAVAGHGAAAATAAAAAPALAMELDH